MAGLHLCINIYGVLFSFRLRKAFNKSATQMANLNRKLNKNKTAPSDHGFNRLPYITEPNIDLHKKRIRII